MSNSEGNFEMTINCEVNRFLIWCEECVIVTGTTDNRIPTFAKTDTKLYVPVLTLSAQDNAKLYQQLRTVSKRTINWKNINQNQSQAGDRYLIYLVDPNFQRVNSSFLYQSKMMHTEEVTSDIFFWL